MKIKSINYLKFLCPLFILIGLQFSCSKNNKDSGSDDNDRREKDSIEEVNIPEEQDLERAMELLDTSVQDYFVDKNEMRLAQFYNPLTEENSEEVGSVWMYTSAIEATNAILKSLEMQKDNGNADLYDDNYEDYLTLLKKLYDNIDFYLGTYTLTSYTQTKQWDVYAVDRVDEKGEANVEGELNVYDDQMWLIRELLQSYKLTDNEKYLEKAEYLTAYVLDGWDSTLDSNGKEYGGITWGPGYTTKHSPSNAPVISSLVWLSDIYEDKSDEITYKYISSKDGKTRKDSTEVKKDFYLDFAVKIYDWMKHNLLTGEGVYDDMLGGCEPCDVLYETINDEKYRKHTVLTERAGPPITYNSGAMISGAYDLYDYTGTENYLDDATELAIKVFVILPI